jgi:hypothetical protein
MMYWSRNKGGSCRFNRGTDRGSKWRQATVVKGKKFLVGIVMDCNTLAVGTVA